MYNYRLASFDDLEVLLDMGKRFHEEYIEPELPIPYDVDSAALAAIQLLETGIVVVAVEGEPDAGPEAIVGMLAAETFPYRFNQHYKMAKEVVFWINPEHRGQRLAAELVSVAGIGAGADDVHYSAMVSLAASPSHVEGLYKALGYRPFETTYIRQVAQEA